MEVKDYMELPYTRIVKEMNDESGHLFLRENLRTGRLPEYRRYVGRIVRKS